MLIAWLGVVAGVRPIGGDDIGMHDLAAARVSGEHYVPQTRTERALGKARVDREPRGRATASQKIQIQ